MEYLRTAPLKQLAGGPRRGAGPSRLRGRERRAAARGAIEIGDTTEETVNVNETTPEKGLTQHMQMKHIHKVDFRCLRQDHVDLCCEVIAVRI